MAVEFKKNSKLHDHMLKQQRLVFDVRITGNATPASKVHASDLPGVASLRTLGKLTEADAVETLAWTTPVDNSTGDSIFGILVNLDGNPAKKVYRAQLIDKGGTATSVAITNPGGSGNSFVTADGNIAVEVAGTGLNLASENATLTLVLDYEQA